MFSMKIHFYTSIARLGNAGDDLNGTEQDFGVSPQIPATPAAPGQQVRPSAVTLHQMMQSGVNTCAGGQFHPLVFSNGVESR